MENFGFRPDSDDNLVLKDIDGHYLDGVDADECSLESGPNKLFTIGEGDENSDSYSRTDSIRSDKRILVERHVFNQSKFDENFKRSRRPVSTFPQRASRKISKYFLSCTPSCVRVFVFNLFPFLTIMKDYNIRTDLSGDIIAGLTVGIMHIPQGMAYGMLTTLPPNYGLYMSFFPVLVYFFFGSSKHISVGTFSVACLMIGTTVTRGYESHKSDLIYSSQDTTNTTDNNLDNTENMSPEEISLRLSFALSLAFMVGVMQLIMGVARLGFITAYLSDPLVSGFTTGAACHVYTSQIKYIFGVEMGQYSGPFKLIYTYSDFFGNLGNQIKWASLITSIISWAILYCVTRFINHNHRFRRKMFMPVPIELIVVVLGTVLSYAFDLKKNFSVKIVGDVPVGLPDPTSPFKHLDDVFLDAFALAVVVFAISISMAKILAKKDNYEVDSNQELIAFGFCNIVSSFFASPSTSASMSRSLTQERAGGKTQVAGLVSCAMLLVVMLALGPYFKTLPNCVLAAIIMEKMRGMFLQVRDIKILWQISIIDSLVWIVALVATVLLDVDIGLGVAVAFALLTTICRSQRPYTCLMGRIEGTDFYQDISVYKKAEEIPGIKIFRCENSPLFLNACHIRRKLYKSTVDPWNLRIANKYLGIDRDGPYPTESLTGYLQALANGGFEIEVPAPYDKSHNLNAEVDTDNPRENHSKVNVISCMEENSECDFHTIILDCSPWNQVDTTGVKTLMSIINEYKKVGVSVVLANCKAGIHETFEKSNFYTVIDRNDIFVSLHDAVEHANMRRDTHRQVQSVAGSTMTLGDCDTKPIIANGNVKNGFVLINNASQLPKEDNTV